MNFQCAFKNIVDAMSNIRGEVEMDSRQLYKLKDATVLVYGDFMVDKYIHGEVNRISPEAPVPVLHVTGKERKFGGAGNVVSNLLALGVKVRVAGFTGSDEDGMWLTDTFAGMGADTAYIENIGSLQTVVKTRITSRNQQFIRLDEEKPENITSELEARIRNRVFDMLREVDAVILSDYGKGNVTPGVAQGIIGACTEREIPVVVDPKGVDYSKYRGATVCKPNEKELAVATGMTLVTDEDVERAGLELKNQNGIDNLIVSRSEKGIMFLNSHNTRKDFPTKAQEVIDVTGAGDTVVAMIASTMAIGIDLEDSCKLANMAAAIVCSKFGAASASVQELIDELEKGVKDKTFTLEEVQKKLQDAREQGKSIVFTNGCFDLLHAGHLSSFRQASQYGDILIAAVNSDASVKRIKGENRPIINEQNRMRMVSALKYVDYVVLMEDNDPTRLISILKPDVVVKGRDWEGKYMPEREMIESYGGKMQFIDLEKGLSTTEIIEKVMTCYEK